VGNSELCAVMDTSAHVKSEQIVNSQQDTVYREADRHE